MWPTGPCAGAGSGRPGLHWQLQAADGDYQLQLELRSAAPPVLNGVAGLSRKADAPGATSYYYSMPRLHAIGSLTRQGTVLPVSGLAWLDREWGSGSLGPGPAGLGLVRIGSGRMAAR